MDIIHGTTLGMILGTTEVGTDLGIIVHGIAHGTTAAGTAAGMEVGAVTIHHGITIRIITTITITIQDHIAIQAMPEDREAEIIMAAEEDIIPMQDATTIRALPHVRGHQDIITAGLPVRVQGLAIATQERIVLPVRAQDLVTAVDLLPAAVTTVQLHARVQDLATTAVRAAPAVVHQAGLVLAQAIADHLLAAVRADQAQAVADRVAQAQAQVQDLAITAAAHQVADRTHLTIVPAVRLAAVHQAHTVAVAAVVAAEVAEVAAAVEEDAADKKIV